MDGGLCWGLGVFQDLEVLLWGTFFVLILDLVVQGDFEECRSSGVQIVKLWGVGEQELWILQSCQEGLRAWRRGGEWSYQAWTSVAWGHWVEGERRGVALGLVEEQ